MPALLNPVAPTAYESAGGFLLRALSANGANVRELLSLTRGSTRRQILPEDAPLYEQLTGTPAEWFVRRIAHVRQGDHWPEIELFGTRWRDDWTLRGQYTQVCPECLERSAVARVEWDLMGYTACPVHRKLLVDRCADCGRALQPNRPAVDVCRCGAFLSRPEGPGQDADPGMLAWCHWLSKAVMGAIGGQARPEPLLASFDGLSIDGWYRLCICLGGGVRALRGAHLNAACPWLDTAAVHEILRQGLDAMRDVDAGRPLRIELGMGCGDSLAEQAVRGITLEDRKAASGLRMRLRLPSRWRNAKQVVHRQGDLFEGWA